MIVFTSTVVSAASVEEALRAAQRGECESSLAVLRPLVAQAHASVPMLTAVGACEAQERNSERAIALFKRAAQLEPESWQALNNLGASYVAAGRPGEAVKPLRQAVRLNGQAVSALVNFAAALARTGNAEQSFVLLDRAQALVPQDAAVMKAWLDSATALASTAAADVSSKRYGEAKKRLLLIERPLAVSPSWHNLIGYTEFKLGHPEPALAHLQKALQMEPDNEDYVLDLGEFLAYHRAHEQAFQIFEVAAKRMSHSPRVQFGLAVALVLQNRRDEATDVLNTLVAAHPDFEPAYRVLGECHEDAGRMEDMVAIGRKLQSVNPRNSYGWYLEGRGLLGESRSGDAPAAPAAAALRRAIQIDPNLARAHFHLARAYEQMGDIARAESELKTTIRIEPQHPRAHYVLGMLYQQTSRQELAKAELAFHRQLKEQDRKAEYRRLLIVSHQGA